MEENDVVEIVRDFISKKFPKRCKCCGKLYNSFAEYLYNTTHAGKPISYDAEMGKWQPDKPMGTLSMAHCSCGTTMAISSIGMNLVTLWRLMNWARKEIKKRGIEMSELLEDLRNKIDKSVLHDERKKIEV